MPADSRGRPTCRADAAAAVSFGQRGMVEIIGRRPRDTDSLHHGRDRKFAGTVNDTISSRPRTRKPKSRAARAASVAYPRPQCSAASRQAISTQGVKWASNRGTESPTNPMKSLTPGTSTAQCPNPRGDVIAEPGGYRVTFSAVEQAGEELHDARVGIQRRERGKVRVAQGRIHRRGVRRVGKSSVPIMPAPQKLPRRRRSHDPIASRAAVDHDIRFLLAQNPFTNTASERRLAGLQCRRDFVVVDSTKAVPDHRRHSLVLRVPRLLLRSDRPDGRLSSWVIKCP